MKNLKHYLQSIGLQDKEADVYLALLSSGTSSVSHIAKKAKVTRTNVYEILEKLKIKGLVGEHEDKKILQYTAAPTDALKNYIQTQADSWQGHILDFASISQSLSKFKKASPLPIMSVFEGPQGIREVLYDQIKEPESQIDLITDIHFEDILGSFLPTFAKLKTSRKIKTRLIMPKDGTGAVSKFYSARTIKETFDIRYLDPELFRPDGEVCIYGNTVSFISLREEEPIGIIINSQAMAHTQKVLFEQLWQAASREP